MIEVPPYTVYCGDAFEVLSGLKAAGVKVDCLVTSPPYFDQRNYGQDPKELGQEKRVETFIAALVRVFDEVPLQPWGNLWINIGNKRGHNSELLGVTSKFVVAMLNAGYYLIDEVVWAKEIVTTDGYSFGHCMIEPAPRRLSGNGWEPFYRFVKDPALAWTDTCAIRIPRYNCPESHRYRPPELMATETMEEGRNCPNVWSVGTSRKGDSHFAAYPAALVERPIAMSCPEWVTEQGPRVRLVESVEYDENRDSKRVFGQYSKVEQELLEEFYGNEFTPEIRKLLRKDEKKLTEEQKTIVEGWREKVEVVLRKDESTLTLKQRAIITRQRDKSGRMDTARVYTPKYPKTIGWTLSDLEAHPGIVLDPFGGTGTSGEVAIKLGRRFIGIDLYKDVAERMEQRCAAAVKASNF